MSADAFKEASQALEKVQAYKSVFSTTEGKIVLKDLAEKCFLNRPVADVNQPVLSVFNDGKRCAVLDILNMIAADDEDLIRKINYLKMED